MIDVVRMGLVEVARNDGGSCEDMVTIPSLVVYTHDSYSCTTTLETIAATLCERRCVVRMGLFQLQEIIVEVTILWRWTCFFLYYDFGNNCSRVYLLTLRWLWRGQVIRLWIYVKRNLVLHWLHKVFQFEEKTNFWSQWIIDLPLLFSWASQKCR